MGFTLARRGDDDGLNIASRFFADETTSLGYGFTLEISGRFVTLMQGDQDGVVHGVLPTLTSSSLRSNKLCDQDVELRSCSDPRLDIFECGIRHIPKSLFASRL